MEGGGLRRLTSNAEAEMKARGARPSISSVRLHRETFVGFRRDLIDHDLHILCAFPHHELPVRARAFAHDALNVPNRALVAELLQFFCVAFEK